MTVMNAPRRRRSLVISPQARTALWASLVGTTIEWYDFFLYATAASLVFNKAFFPDQTTFVGTCWPLPPSRSASWFAPPSEASSSATSVTESGARRRWQSRCS